MFNNTINGLREDLIGKDFVYVSKYGGEVKGTVKGVSLMNCISFDAESGRKLKIGFTKSGKTELKELDFIEKKVPFSWSGESFEIQIQSTNDVMYELGKDKIYFLL